MHTRWRSWLRQHATCRKGTGSIPDNGIFHRHDRFDRIMTLASTQLLKEMSTRSISWGKGGLCETYLLEPIVSKFRSLNLLEPSGGIIGLYRDCFTFSSHTHTHTYT